MTIYLAPERGATILHSVHREDDPQEAPLREVVIPKVLVLLAARNGASWIAEQVESILNQVEVDVTLVISDDGSTDDTGAELRPYVDDPRICWLSPPRPTGSAAQNFLWTVRGTPSNGHSHVAFSDQDDLWLSDKLRRACGVLEVSGAAGYSCPVSAFWEDGREALLRQSSRLTQSDFLFEGAGQGCTFVLTAEVYDRMRAFLLQCPVQTDAIRYHDWLIYALSRSWKLPWAFDTVPMLKYRQHAANDTGARASLRAVTKRLNLIVDGWYSTQLRTIAAICREAAPEDQVIIEWMRLLSQPNDLRRRLRVARFFIRGGRRRRSDNMVLVISALVGWV
jgi:rhamnosyltransferase